MFGGDEVSALVLDTGSLNIKAGFAGEEAPKAIFPSSLGVIKRKGNFLNIDETNLESQSSNNYYIGPSSVYFRRDEMEIESPFQNGLISDWDLIERLWSYTISTALHSDPREHPILLSEPTHNTKQIRERTTEIFFEKFQVPGFFISKNSVLSAFASGRATALILESSASGTVAVPVFEGYALKKNIAQSNLGGEKLTNDTISALEKKNIIIQPNYSFVRKEVVSGEYRINLLDYPKTTQTFHKFSILNIARDLKESIFRVSDTTFDETLDANIPTIPFELPNGRLLEIGTERFSVAEQLFSTNTNIQNSDSLAIQYLVQNSVKSCDLDIRKDLYTNIVVCGGNSLIHGFNERLSRELTNLSTIPTKTKIVPATNIEKKYSTWIGGSILGSLGSFQQMWMSKSEYEEHGSRLVERKCP
eukprot:TRINITY_DN8463_c0_g1_i1.p1 TRINITY_DN8463_c0_g1~~TRINITY_DN8463_c0_g1_i1.p1  ORF type:complete len:418 (-),score=177.42 TRINITY_DN8463_c0_g1_i1:181-1434(-)